MESTILLAWLGAILFIFLTALSLVTLGLSWWTRRQERLEEQDRQHVRDELFEQIDREPQARESWIAGLSDRERAVLTSLVEHYLRLLSGQERARYQELAAELALGARAEADLTADPLGDRLQAIAMLSLLDHPISYDRLEETCVRSQETREAAARLLLERREEFEQPAARATRLLLWEGTEPLSVYGLETLSRLNAGEESPLLDLAAEHVSKWNTAVVSQVCLVIEHTEQLDPGASIDWLFPLLAHSDPELRAAAVGAFTPFGWREDIRNRLDVRSLLADPAPVVRKATYALLTEWGGSLGHELLLRAVRSEPNDRARLAAMRGLHSIEPNVPVSAVEASRSAWIWIHAEQAILEGDALELPDPTGSVA